MIIKYRVANKWFDVFCEEAVVPLIDGSENIAISVLDDREVVVIRHGKGYPNGGECVWSEILSDA